MGEGTRRQIAEAAVLLPDYGTPGCPPLDAVQLDAANLVVLWEVTAPADDHRRLQEAGTAVLQRLFPSRTVVQRQLPAHTQVPGKQEEEVWCSQMGPNLNYGDKITL